jgi:acetyltransferase-like isoleucine patch superfamily enzyme
MENLLHILERIRAKTYTFLLSSCFNSVGKRSTVYPPLRFGNLKMVRIGDFVTVHPNCWIQAVGEDRPKNSPKLIVKNHVSIGMSSTISAAHQIVIEDYVLMARNVFISDHLHGYEDVGLPISQQPITKVRGVTIGAGSWLCQNSVILPGVTIGKNCVIGANSVVNADVPDYTVVAGAPAKIVKRYDESRQKWMGSAGRE